LKFVRWLLLLFGGGNGDFLVTGRRYRLPWAAPSREPVWQTPRRQVTWQPPDRRVPWEPPPSP
jgi:hypothetical protein